MPSHSHRPFDIYDSQEVGVWVAGLSEPVRTIGKKVFGSLGEEIPPYLVLKIDQLFKCTWLPPTLRSFAEKYWRITQEPRVVLIHINALCEIGQLPKYWRKMAEIQIQKGGLPSHVLADMRAEIQIKTWPPELQKVAQAARDRGVSVYTIAKTLDPEEGGF